MTAEGIWPRELNVLTESKKLLVSFNDGKAFELPFELLRVESPSAEVQGHVPSQKTTVAGKRHVGVKDLEPVGNYAVRIVFDDGHNSGIFTWDYLRELGENQDQIWQNYLDALQAIGGQR